MATPGRQLTVPALQRERSHACVACGAAADAYCAQCGVTPYCSPQCQRRDWGERHRGVCHNLARLFKKTESLSSAEEVARIPTAPPLRRPRSPGTAMRDDDKTQKKPAQVTNNNNRQPNRNHSNQNKSNQNNSNQNNSNQNNSNQNNRGNNNNNRKFQNNQRPMNNRNQQRTNQVDEVEEEWGQNKNEIEEATPTPKPIPPTDALKPAREEVRVEPKMQPKVEPKPVLKPPVSVSDVMPTKKLVPKSFLVEVLPLGEQVLLSVDAAAGDCRSRRSGFVCLTMHENYKTEFQALCETYVVDCERDNAEYTPKPGESFSYFNQEDGGWYRARCLSGSVAALLDSSRLVDFAGAKARRLAAPYDTYPEFCCLLTANAKVGDNLMATLVSKTAEGFRVTLENIDSGAPAGEGEVFRWLPTVDYPTVAPPPSLAVIQPQLPEVCRPDLVHNSHVLLVELISMESVVVRSAGNSAQRKYDGVVHDVILHGRSARPLTEPPLKGQVVIVKHKDGLHYRALCKRTSIKQNKYMLEFIDHGITEVSQLESLYPCPPSLDLANAPTEASLASLPCGANALSQPALDYVAKLKEGAVELLLTLPSGAKSAASGSAINLTLAKNGESLNKKLQEMSTPDWKKIEERGGDVVELECLHYKALEYPSLPSGGCELDISDISNIESGVLSGCPRGLPLADHVMTTLTQRMADYCNSELGKEPYLPKNEELCIAPFPPYSQWFRAVLIEHFTGCPTAKVCYVDYGNVEEIPVNTIRKMLPEFVRGEPALAIHLEIRDFPKPATTEMLARAVTHMRVADDGRGVLRVGRCDKIENGMYMVDAPDLIRAVLGK